MLTVLIRHLKSKREWLEECEAVEFEHDRTAPNAGLLIVNRDGNSNQIPFSSDDANLRDVFVMNGAGQTVAQYTL
jgi:hypothetical protein